MKHLKIYYFYCLYFRFFFLSVLSSGFHPHNLEGVYKLFQPIPHFSRVVIGTSFRIWHSSQFLPPGLVSCPWCFLMLGPLPSLSSQLWEWFQVQPHITLCLLVSFSLGTFIQCCILTDPHIGPSSMFIWTSEVNWQDHYFSCLCCSHYDYNCHFFQAAPNVLWWSPVLWS